MNEQKRNPDAGGLFAGIMLIGIGTLFLLDRLGYADLHDVLHNYWPMFLVVFGLSRFVHRRRSWSGVWLIVIGLWLQATTLHLWGVTFDSSWPLLLIAIGGVMVLRTLLAATRGKSLEDGDGQ
jgi:hypothetical protein